MEKLVLNPKKISLNKNDNNFFLGKWFINCLTKDQKKKINFSTFDTPDFNFDNELTQSNYIKKIFKEILIEIIPTLNQLNNVKWDYRIWNFFLGHWMHHYIAVILDRINLVKPLFKSDINYDEQLILGRSTFLTSYTLKDFTRNAGLIGWNEKLISRIIYLIKTQDFNNNECLLSAEKYFKTQKENFFILIAYNFKVSILKFFGKLLCKKNNFLFYNSYIKNKFKLLNIILKLGDVPFLYSLSFFNQRIIKKGVNAKLRKKFKINIDSQNLNLRIIKSLLIECLPTIYLEGFQLQKKIADNSHLPKKIKVVFTSAVYNDETFKFWLADKMNSGTKLAHGQHGGGAYFVLKELFWETFEIEISNKYFNWGKKKNSSNVINIGNYLLSSKNKKNIENKNYLLVFPATDLFKRNILIWDIYHHTTNSAMQYQKFIDNINFDLINELSLRFNPQDNARRELKYSELINFDNKKIKEINHDIKLENLTERHSLIIFSYLSTEFFKMMSLNEPCLVLVDKKNIEDLVTDTTRNDFKKLVDAGIMHTNGLSLAKHLNLISSDLGYWWNSEKIINTRTEFCNNYSDPNFNIDNFVYELKLLK